MNFFDSAAFALVLDRIVGDPRFVPHPVVLIGKYISFCERRLYREKASRFMRRVSGVLLTVSTVALANLLPWLGLQVLRHYSVWMYWMMNVFLVATTIAWNGLTGAGQKVLHRLHQGGIEAARFEVSMIVGRDTDHMSEDEVIRATVETLAENIVDAIVSPLFYACLGGAPLALLYRAANTLDSMVGYKNERYQDFGWCSARFDDVLNYIPARLAIVFLWIAAWLTKRDAREALIATWRDARKHPSPNSGIPESMVAGALGVQLGGVNFYGGVKSDRARMGIARRPLESADITRTIWLIHVVCLICIIAMAVGGI